MKLCLMRHGQAQSRELDPNQGLSDEGKAEVLQLTQNLEKRDITFKKIIHSGKTRARQTAEIIRDAISADAELTESDAIKPNDDPATIFNQIPGWKSDTLIVSHLPFIPELIKVLCQTDLKVPIETATMVCLEKNTGNWELLWVETP